MSVNIRIFGHALFAHSCSPLSLTLKCYIKMKPQKQMYNHSKTHTKHFCILQSYIHTNDFCTLIFAIGPYPYVLHLTIGLYLSAILRRGSTVSKNITMLKRTLNDFVFYNLYSDSGFLCTYVHLILKCHIKLRPHGDHTKTHPYFKIILYIQIFFTLHSSWGLTLM